VAIDDARTKLLETAGPVFAEKGYQGATVREICDKAGVNVAAINYHFGGKERLYIESVKLAHPLSRVPKLAFDWAPDTPPEQKLSDFIHRFITQMAGTRREPWQSQLVIREITCPTAACRELVEGYFRMRFNVLQTILDEILPKETPVHQRHKIGFSVIGQCVHFSMGAHVVGIIVGEDEWTEHYQPEQVAQHITQVCLAALGLAAPLITNEER